jgi:hypothetical protein
MAQAEINEAIQREGVVTTKEALNQTLRRMRDRGEIRKAIMGVPGSNRPVRGWVLVPQEEGVPPRDPEAELMQLIETVRQDALEFIRDSPRGVRSSILRMTMLDVHPLPEEGYEKLVEPWLTKPGRAVREGDVFRAAD